MSELLARNEMRYERLEYALGSQRRSDSLTSWILYPALMTLSFSLYLGFVAWGVPQFISNYLPIVLACGFLTYYEWRTPHKESWHPKLADIGNDSLYTVLVQIALPELLTLGVALWVISISAGHIAIVDIWPQSWPVLAQALLMLLIADVLRYWWHRLSHSTSLLWRFHEVHHSPDKLYWLNSGRFHPMEKLVHYLHDALPFLLLGVSPEVMGAYFVFFAVNAYFLHSNIDLNYGWLRFVMNTAHAHRWHHSKVPEESNNNYGNILIIWDILFGTFLLPKDREPQELGPKDEDYPKRFWPQTMAPFRRNNQQ